MTQAMYQRARGKMTSLRVNGPTTLEPIVDADKLRVRRRPGGKLDGSLNTSLNLSLIKQKYKGLDQFIKDSMGRKSVDQEYDSIT